MKYLLLFLLSLNSYAFLSSPGSGGGGSSWGSITGDLNDQTDLKTQLDQKRLINNNATVNPDNNGGGQGYHFDYFSIVPLQNSPNESWNFYNLSAEFDANNEGYTLGTNGQASTLLNMYFKHIGSSDIGATNFINTSMDIGNGTDAINYGGHSLIYGFGNINDNITLTGPVQGYGFQYSIDENAICGANCYFNAFYDFTTSDAPLNSYTTLSAGPNIAEIKNNSNMTTININPTVDNFAGNANYNGIGIAGNFGTFGTGGFNGILINPTVDDVGDAYGIYSDVNNITADNKWAGYFNGDVQINGDLAFSGALGVGKLTAYDDFVLSDGGGNPQSVHELVQGVTGPNGQTIANIDYIGVNTASLITLEDNFIGTSGAFQLGLTSLAFPNVVVAKTGSNLDYLNGAVFAINLDSINSTGGTIQNVRGARSVFVPNGITTVNESVGFFYHEPFGAISSNNYGIKIEDASYNLIEGELKVDGGVQLGTSGSQPTCNSSNRGMFWNVEGGTGVADQLQICQKNASDVYGWVNI